MYNKSLHLTFFRCRSKMQVNSVVRLLVQLMCKEFNSLFVTI